MEEDILKIIKGLTKITEKAKIKWSDGSSENEYFINLEGTGIVVAKSSDADYELRFLKPNGTVNFSVTYSVTDGENYQEIEKLFNTIVVKSPEAIQTIEDLLKKIEKNQ